MGVAAGAATIGAEQGVVPMSSGCVPRWTADGIAAVPLLAMIRHGESDWNRENRCTGWGDVEFSETGVA